jgi:TonB family protein
MRSGWRLAISLMLSVTLAIAAHARAGDTNDADDQALTEDQALDVLAGEISRKVGLQTQASDYPEEARRWNWSGTALVRVLVGSDGMLRDIAIAHSSGFQVLDHQALQMVGRVRKASWIPVPLRGRDVTVQVPIGFLPPPAQ